MTPSDSFTAVLEAYGESHPPSPTYRAGDDFPEWQERFRRQLESLRSPVPDRVPLQVEILESTEDEGHTRHLLRVSVSDCSSLIAYLLVPHGIRVGEKRPGLIAIHGHYKHGIDSICGVRVEASDPNNDIRHAYALHAVREGYIVLAPALWGWPGRDGHLDLVGGLDRCNVAQIAAGMYGLNMVDLHIQDCQAALDLLASRPEVDEERIGCLGNSTGGRMTMWLSVFDERVKACVPSGSMNTFRERSLKLSSCGIQYPFGLLRYGDVPEIFSLISPRPMQLQAGEGDGLITPQDRDRMETQVRGAYRLLDAEAAYDYVLHGEGHLLRWDRAAPFLARHLEL